MPGLLRDADVVCAPALGPESAGIVLLEAMAAGTAVVASDVAGHRERVTDGREGLLVPARDVRALAAALRTLVDDGSARQRLAAAAARTADGYDWEVVADAHEARRLRPRDARHMAAARPKTLIAGWSS